MTNTLTSNKQNKILPLLISFISAVVLLLICSQASPLYPIQSDPDIQCFFTVGRSMLHGAVPYRDIMEQKGPLLYFLFEGIAWISECSFIGLWFVEIICATIFLYFSWKILQLFSSAHPIWIFGIGIFVYPIFGITCGNVEELALPALSYAFYIVLRSVKQDKSISIKSSFIVGITASIIFWMKYTIISMYLGFLIAILIFKLKKDKLKLLNICWGVLTGFIIVTIPILIYFTSNNALSNLFTVYFYNNMTAYSNFNIFTNLGYKLVTNILANPYGFAAVVFSILLFIKKSARKYLWIVLIVMFTYFICIFIGGRIYFYYCIPYSIFIPFGIAYIDTKYKNIIAKYNKTENKFSFILSIPHKKAFIIILCVLGYVFAIFTSPSTSLLKFNKNKLVQNKFAEIINQEENATLLNYGMLDYGFYTATGILPNCKYFCGLNIPLDEIKEEQDNAIKNQSIDFIVTFQNQNFLETNYSTENINTGKTRENMFEEYGYYLIETYYSEYDNGTFYLYELED